MAVGARAAGKTTLVTALGELNLHALVSGQEHSKIAALWRLQNLDVLLLLNADIAAVRDRHDGEWPTWLHGLQVKKLATASGSAHTTIDATRFDSQTAIARVVGFLEQRHPG